MLGKHHSLNVKIGQPVKKLVSYFNQFKRCFQKIKNQKIFQKVLKVF